MANELQIAIQALDDAVVAADQTVADEKARGKEELAQMPEVWRIQGKSGTKALTLALRKSNADRMTAIEAMAQTTLAAQLPDLRAAAYDALDGADLRAQAAAHRVRLAEFDQFDAASGRADFVREDVDRMHVSDIAPSYQVAAAAGDKTGAWLLARYGRARLEKMQEAGDIDVAVFQAVADLDALAPDAGAAGLRDARRQIEEARLDIERPRGRVEQQDAKQEFGARFGIDPQYIEGDLAFAVRR